MYIRGQRPWTFKKQVNHPKFGLLWYNRPYIKGESGYYQGQYFFTPKGGNVDFYIYSNKEYPNESGLNFLSKLENEKSFFEETLVTKISEYLKSDFNKVKDYLSLEIIIIKELNNGKRQSLLNYWMEDTGLTILVYLEDLEVKNIEKSS